MNSYLKIFISSAAGLACAAGQIRQPDQLLDPGVNPPRVHSTWTIFLHPRLGFELPIPPGVSAVGSPEAANEPQFQSADQNFVMSAWGGIANDHPSKVMAAQWDAAQQKAGRDITYQRRGTTWFVMSGTDFRGIEFYEKFTMRGQQVAFLDITFPKSLIRQYETWVEQIEDGFRPVALREGPLEVPRNLSRSRAGAVTERTPTESEIPAVLAKTAPAPKQESKLMERTSEKRPGIEVAPIADKLPSAVKVVGKPGFVYSPFSSDHRIVDVVDVPSGTKVKCPYTMKIFRVP